MADSVTEARRLWGFAVAFFAFSVTTGASTIPTALYPLYRERFGISELTIRLIYATYAGGAVLGLVFFGRISDHLGRRRTLAAGLALAAVSALLLLFAEGLAAFFFGRFMCGLAVAVASGTATAAMVDLAGPRSGDRATLAATTANVTAPGVGALIGGILAEWGPHPLRVPYLVVLVALLVAATASMTIPETVTIRHRLEFSPGHLRIPASMRSIFLRAALVTFAGYSVVGTFTGTSSAFLAGPLHESNRAVLGLVVFGLFAASTAGQVMMKRLGERLAFRAGCIILMLGLAALAVGLISGMLLPFAIGGVVAGFGQGLGFRAGLGTVNAAAPRGRRAEAASALFVTAFLGGAVSVIGEGALGEVAGLRLAGLSFVAVAAATAACALVLLSRLDGELGSSSP